jgi:quinol monooxygenase YgiN
MCRVCVARLQRGTLTRPNWELSIAPNRRDKSTQGRETVRQFFQLVLSMTVLSAVFAGAANAQGATGPVYLTTYYEVMPASANAGAGILRQYRDASQKEAGNQRFEAVQEVSRPNRFVILEVWKDQAALDAHRKAASTTQFRDKYKAIQNSPFDERVNTGMFGGPLEASGPRARPTSSPTSTSRRRARTPASARSRR